MNASQYRTERERRRLNSEMPLCKYEKTQTRTRVPFLVRMRLHNLVYAATSTVTRTDYSEMASTLITAASARPYTLAGLMDDYKSMTVTDFKPEATDMRVAEAQTEKRLHKSDKEPMTFMFSYPIRERLDYLTASAAESSTGLRASMANVVSALVVGASTDGIVLEKIISRYREFTVGDFNPVAETSLLSVVS